MLEGIRVVEVGTWVMVPGSTAVLADHGAEVIKVEQPGTGDPVRGGSPQAMHGGVNLLFEQLNRGKRSIALDLTVPEGREVLGRLVASADAFVTNLLPRPRRKLRVDVDDIRTDNPRVVYVRGSGVGPRGDEAGRQGFDFGVFWARAGFQSAVAHGSGHATPVNPRPGFGDRTSAMNLAFGVAAALLHRERTGRAPVVDVSLLGSGFWSNASDIVYSAGSGRDASATPYPRPAVGGLVRTGDDRWIQFNLQQPDRWFAEMCGRIGRPELVDDPRFADPAARREHHDELLAVFDAAFASRPLAEWRERLATLPAAWEPVQDPYEATQDPQVRANGYLAEVAHPAGTIRLVPAPVEFDDTPVSLRPAPALGADTDALLAELGFGESEVAAQRAAGAFG